MTVSFIDVINFIKDLISNPEKMEKFKEIISDVKELVSDIKDVINAFKG